MATSRQMTERLVRSPTSTPVEHSKSNGKTDPLLSTSPPTKIFFPMLKVTSQATRFIYARTTKFGQPMESRSLSPVQQGQPQGSAALSNSPQNSSPAPSSLLKLAAHHMFLLMETSMNSLLI